MNSKGSPIVSVILPTYNSATLLRRALDSIIAQTMKDWEIVLVDDGSTDETPAVAHEYEQRLGDRLNYIRQPNGGASSARNAGIDAARGRFVAFLDADDEYLPGKLARQLEFFQRCPRLGLVYGDYAYIDLAGVRHESVFDKVCPVARTVPSEMVVPGLYLCTDDLFDKLIQAYFIPTIVGMVRREVLGDDIRFRTDLTYAEEWMFYLTVSKACKAGFIDEPLCLHHHTAGSLGRTNTRSNFQRSLQTFKAIDAAFSNVPRSKRKPLHAQTAQNCRQLGYYSCRDRQFWQAARYFADSLRYKFTTRGLFEATRATAMSLIPARSADAKKSADVAEPAGAL